MDPAANEATVIEQTAKTYFTVDLLAEAYYQLKELYVALVDQATSLRTTPTTPEDQAEWLLERKRELAKTIDVVRHSQDLVSSTGCPLCDHKRDEVPYSDDWKRDLRVWGPTDFDTVFDTQPPPAKRQKTKLRSPREFERAGFLAIKHGGNVPPIHPISIWLRHWRPHLEDKREQITAQHRKFKERELIRQHIAGGVGELRIDTRSFRNAPYDWEITRELPRK
jgi:hypothetical protein